MGIDRVSENIYRLSGSQVGNQKPVEVLLHFKKGDPELSFAIAKEAHRVLFDEGGGDLNVLTSISYGNSNIKFSLYSSAQDKARSVGARVTNLIHKKAAPSKNLQELSVSIHDKNKTKVVSEEKDRLFATEPTAQFADDLDAPRFSDPYTKLSALAFKRHEPHYFNREVTDYAQASTKIVDSGNGISLVENKNEDVKDREANTKTIERYYTEIVKEYGSQKISQIETHFDLSFADMIKNGEPLTPEVVYRVNIGTLICTTDDVSQFAKNLIAIKNAMLDGNPSANLNFRDLLEYDAEYSHLLPASQLRSALAAIESGSNVDSLYQALAKKQDLTNTDMNVLMGILTPNAEELQNAFTGKQTHAVTHSDYTYADRSTQKLWIEQQELQETFLQIANSDSWDFFYEKLDYVICKRNLILKDQEVGFKANQLIPAPRGKNGEKRWFKLTSMVSNGHGLMTYTLEPAGTDDSLPAVKVFRSTATSGMHMDNYGSLLNDFNPINGVGYEGRVRTEVYDNNFISPRTIPVWVGYSMLASEAVDNFDGTPERWNEAVTLLEKTAAQRVASEYKKLQPRKLDQIIRDSDDILNDLFYAGNADSAKTADFKQYTQFYKNELIPLAQNKTEINKPREELLATRLILLIQNAKKQITDPAMLHKMDLLIHELGTEVVTDEAEAHAQAEMQSMQERFVKPLQAALHSSQGAADQKQRLEQALALIDNEINLAGESPDSKIAEDIVFTGHSLGGAAAQVDLVEKLTHQDRMPLPGCMVTGHLLGEPKIHNRDNEDFIASGNEHRDLFRASGVKWRIKRIHETGDPLTTAGFGRHLGSAVTTKEKEQLAGWCEDEFIVRKRRITAEDKAVRVSHFVHETQFSKGVRRSAATEGTGSDYEQTNVDPLVLGLYDSKGKNAPELSRNLPDVAKTWDVNKLVSTGLQEIPKFQLFDKFRQHLYRKRESELKFKPFEDNSGVFAVYGSTGVASKQN